MQSLPDIHARATQAALRRHRGCDWVGRRDRHLAENPPRKTGKTWEADDQDHVRTRQVMKQSIKLGQ
ncbi:hypothetical protein Y032_0080g1312 [Ancylostoma ceylanicum]|uniref:Uncharacterized protein n=1 Tax=Ancylostoma ceylanicum TaxID=53326 RepID=A0A016TSR9_9BILA|nr:hypothetical protein Y032_0080g1312 [Ancylostoma ceylanicum]